VPARIVAESFIEASNKSNIVIFYSFIIRNIAVPKIHEL
jgi:hypothetical protein